MFQTVGRSLDPWYPLKMLIAAVLLWVLIVVTAYIILGILFIRLVLWFILAVIAFLLQTDPLMAWPIEPVEITVYEVDVAPPEDEDDFGDFELTDFEPVIDIEPPPLPSEAPPGEADPDVMVEARVEKVLQQTALLKILGTTGSNGGAIADVFGSGDVDDDLPTAGLLGVLGTTGSGDGQVFGGILGTLNEGEAVGLGGIGVAGGGVLGGVEGGVVGGVIGGVGIAGRGDPPVRVEERLLSFRRRKPPGHPGGDDAYSCSATLVFDRSGKVEQVDDIDCDGVDDVERALRRWTITPYERDGEPRRVRTRVQFVVE